MAFNLYDESSFNLYGQDSHLVSNSDPADHVEFTPRVSRKLSPMARRALRAELREQAWNDVIDQLMGIRSPWESWVELEIFKIPSKSQRNQMENRRRNSLLCLETGEWRRDKHHTFVRRVSTREQYHTNDNAREYMREKAMAQYEAIRENDTAWEAEKQRQRDIRERKRQEAMLDPEKMEAMRAATRERVRKYRAKKRAGK
jgi:hypothetical protein